MAFRNFVSDFCGAVARKILTLLVTCAFTLLIPVGIILMPVFYLLRKLVVILAKILRPDLAKILSAPSTVMAVDDINKNPVIAATLFVRMKGSVDIEDFKAKLVNEVIGVREVRGELKNIECRQYPYKWLGFIFWKWDEHFDISNHIKYYEDGKNPDAKISVARIREIEHEILFRPFPEKRSPWNGTVFRNVESETGEDETVIVFHMHHSLGDGYSLLKVVCFELVDEIERRFVPGPMFPKKTWMQHLSFFGQWLISPYLMAEYVVEATDRNEWRIPASKMSQNWIANVSDEVPVAVIKDVKDSFDCSVTAVIFSAVTAALRQAMLKKNGRVPKHIHTGMAFPMQFHADKLRNIVVIVFLKLPVGEQDPVRRLKLVEQNLQKLKNSPAPHIAYFISVVIGFLFPWMIRLILRNTSVTAGGSTFPGPKTRVKFHGHEFLDAHFAVGPLPGNIGVAFTTLTTHDNFKARFMVNANILNKQEEVDEITKDVIEEIHVLKRCAKSVV